MLTRRPPRQADASRALAYAALYLPFCLAAALGAMPNVSYGVAWLGSWFILWLTLSGKIKPLPGGVPAQRQLLRPLVLTQVAFAGYTALTSIFFVLDAHGVGILGPSHSVGADPDLLDRLAAGQRYYVLAHAAFANGILARTNYESSGRWRPRATLPLPSVLLAVTLLALAVALVAGRFPGLQQVAIRLQMIGMVSSVLGLALTLAGHDRQLVLPNIGLYAMSVIQALISGWKEEFIIVAGLLAVFAYPYYRRTVLALAPVFLLVGLFILPSYTAMVRALSWNGKVAPREAAWRAWTAIADGSVDLAAGTHEFLIDRASEIGLFEKYIEETPSRMPFLGTSTVAQSVALLVPRIVWPDKPDVETVVMQRVYDNHVVSRDSHVSAKPQFVVDGYLSAGAFGVWLACFLLGAAASLASQLAERWFGGYLIGSGLVYTSLFTVFWRGNAFEFLVNTVFWSFIAMFALFHVMRLCGWLVRDPARAPPRRLAYWVPQGGAALSSPTSNESAGPS